MKSIDLHVHSTASDGTLSPKEVALYAHEKGLSAIALTDHDTIDGVDPCMEAAAPLGLTIIPGVEFSADYHGKEVHILGYGIHHQDPIFIQQLDALKTARQKRNDTMRAKLSDLGMPLSEEDLLEGLSPNTIITRAHFANALVRKGYIPNKDKAFTKYIGSGKPAFVPKGGLTASSCIELIHSAGGLAVLAHPLLYNYSNKEVTQILKDLCSQGLDGVECLYATHTIDQTQHLLQVCQNLDLLPTGGSDFHGQNKVNLDLGSGYGNLTVPYDLLDALMNRLKH